MRPPGSLVVAVVGPTATGKSDLAVALARRLDAEIINADALQLYRGMDIGTAKLTPAQRGGVPHHLLDVLNVAQDASLAAYQEQARALVGAIQQRGRLPIVVGGSGLYVRAALDRLHIPPTDPDVRTRWEERLAVVGPTALHAELSLVDPVAAQSILPSNGRRVVRALEVVELTGRPFSASLPEPAYAEATVQIGLTSPRPELAERTRSRVDRMFRDGLVPEVERLVAHGLRDGRTARRAVGYAQVLRALDRELSVEVAQELTAVATRQLVRRQESWFGRDRRISWLPAEDGHLLERALAVVAGSR